MREKRLFSEALKQYDLKKGINKYGEANTV